MPDKPRTYEVVITTTASPEEVVAWAMFVMITTATPGVVTAWDVREVPDA